MENIKSSILLIDDHPMLRNGVKQLINTINDFEVIGETGSGIEGVKLAQTLDPDIILLDNMNDVSGLEILRYLREKNISARIIMFTVSDAKEDIVTALKTGADGYLLKDMEPENLLKALKDISEGKIIMDEAISHIILDYMRHGGGTTTNQSHDINLLTPREHEIFNLLVQGLSNKLIAKELDIVESTVKVHIKSIFKKLNFKSRMEMTVWYLQSKE